MEITLADYRILSDRGFILSEDQDQEFETGSVINIDNSGDESTNPFLSFQVRPLTDKVRFKVDVNEKGVITMRTNSNGKNVSRVIQEPFRPSFINKNDPNRVQFRVLEGEAAFGEVILHFQQRRNFNLG